MFLKFPSLLPGCELVLQGRYCQAMRKLGLLPPFIWCKAIKTYDTEAPVFYKMSWTCPGSRCSLVILCYFLQYKISASSWGMCSVYGDT